MKKHGMVLVVGILVLALSGTVAGCGKKEEGGGDKLQAAMEAVSKQKNPENYLTLSLRYYEAGQFEKSIEASRESLKLNPDYALAYNNICASYNQMKMWDNGIEACQQALKINPALQIAKNNLNWALRQRSQ